MEPTAVEVTVKEAGVKGPAGTGCGFAGGGATARFEEPHRDKSDAATRATPRCITCRRVSLEDSAGAHRGSMSRCFSMFSTITIQNDRKVALSVPYEFARNEINPDR